MEEKQEKVEGLEGREREKSVREEGIAATYDIDRTQEQCMERVRRKDL